MTRIPKPVRLLLAVAVLAAPFLWTRYDLDLKSGRPFLAFSPGNAIQFLSIVGPGLAIGASAFLVGSLVGKSRTGSRPRMPEILRTRRVRLVLYGVFVASFAFLSDKALDQGIFVCIHMILALGLNITIGFTGLLVLGYSAFYSVGAYSFAIALQHVPAMPIWLGLPLGFVASALVGFLVGLPCLRLRGDYLAIVTLGFAEAFHELVRNLGATGGDMGLRLPTDAGFQSIGPLSAHQAGWLTGATLVLVTTIFVRNLYHSRTGRAWIAIREDETAAAMMGIPVARLKLLAFAISAGLAGVSGVFFASHARFVDPSTSTFELSVLVLAMVILGGIGSIRGALAGAFLLYLVPTLLRDQIPQISDYRLLFFGAILVAMMLLRPQGLLGSARHKLELEGGK